MIGADTLQQFRALLVSGFRGTEGADEHARVNSERSHGSSPASASP